jgi:biotin--protein ligase
VEKSEREITSNSLYEIAKSIKNDSTLKLPNNNEVSTLLQSELEKSFRIDSFMNFLSTNQFGRSIKDREFQFFF